MPRLIEPIKATPEGSFDQTKLCIQDFAGTIIARTPHYKPIDRDHAASVVHRYNMHSELVEQLQAVLARLDLEPPDSIFPCSAMREDIRRTLARSKFPAQPWIVQYRENNAWCIAGIYEFEHDAVARKHQIESTGKIARMFSRDC